MRKEYIQPECVVNKTFEAEGIMGMSVYDAGNSTSVDNAGDGDSPVSDDSGIIWNDAKPFSDMDAWDDFMF